MEGSAITVKIGAETDGIQQGLKNIQNSLKNLEGNTKNSAAEFGASFAKIAGAVAVGQAAFEGFKAAASFGLSAVTDSIGALVGSFGSAIDAAAEMETLETAFIPLLGSADAAQSRIAELAKFAAETPFEMPEIAKASKTLETLTRGALSTAEGLRLVGDVASATNTPFEEISTTIGRLYDGLQSGRPVGEVMQRLQELGAVSGDTRAQIEALSASGKNTEAWLVAEEALSRFSGSMKLQSSTWAGLLSTFSDNVTQALAKFGEPILDNLKPYLSASIKLVEMLAEKSADFGKEFSEQFIASSSAAKAFQTAIEAINIGETSKGFDLFWQTTKLQVQQTGNSIINIFSATFATVSDIISQIFRADGPALLTITSAFDAVAGKLKASIAGGLADTIRSLGPAFTNIADGLEQSAAAGATQAELAIQRIPVAAGLAAEDIGTVLGGSVDLFKKNLGEANTQFFNTSAAAQQVADIESEIAAKVAETNAARGETTAQLDAEKARRQQIRDAAQATAEEERANSLALVELETALNTAKAAGNEELVTALEQEKTRLENQQEIAKLTGEYQKTLGVNADEAARLATNFVNAKNAVSAIGDKNAVVTVAVNTKELDDLITKLRVADNPHLVDVICKVTGAKSLAEAEQTLQNIQAAEGKKDVIFSATKAKSWDEVFDKLSGLPPVSSRKLAMSLTKTNNFDEALDQIWKVPESKDVKMQLKAAGFESLKSFKASLTEIPSQKDTKVICEALNVEDLEGAKKLITNLLAFNGATTEIKAAADTTPAENALNDTARARSTTVSASADTTKAQQAIENLSSKAIKGNLDASESIKTIRKDLEKEVDLGLNSSDGTKILGNIESLLDDLKTIVDTLSQRLPTPALV